jgi:hypothetical protein
MSIVLVGSTSGSITLQEPAVAGTTVLDLPAVSGTILTTTSPKAGNVIQVVNATYSTQVTNSTSTYADTGLTATITPSSSSSKILVLVNQTAISRGTGNVSSQLYMKLLRNSSDLSVFLQAWSYNAASAYFPSAAASICYLDSPATTSATIYKTQFQNGANAAIVTVQEQNSTSTITLMEIAA